ncbi:hypothetical protein TYRP_023739 [Tyrophagus putrescentiae]|nr:hypothetical protein TYRP_023739 [Tyrophagus putrescentiae]
MASDEAIRERSRAWSCGWLSHRLAAAQRLLQDRLPVAPIIAASLSRRFRAVPAPVVDSFIPAPIRPERPSSFFFFNFLPFTFYD